MSHDDESVHRREAEAWARRYQRGAQELYDDVRPAVAVPRCDGFAGLEVVCCPFCGGPHAHSPGYGVRSAHCGRGEYILVPPYGAVVEP